MERFSRALLRHLRLNGYDRRALILRARLEGALARLTELARCPDADAEVVQTIMRMRIGYIGTSDQINATIVRSLTT